jgi:hypothetical protein
MYNIQYILLFFFIFLVFLISGYYIYQNYKFKKNVNNSFSKEDKDIIHKENDFIFDTLDSSVIKEPQELFPEDSVESKFNLYDKIENKFLKYIDNELDYVIDIIFNQTKSTKLIPDVYQYLNNKKIDIYALDDNNVWHLLTSGLKLKLRGIKYVVNLVDNDGIVNSLQINNLYNELYKFVLLNDAHIRQSNYPELLKNIMSKLKNIKLAKFQVELFLLFKNYINFEQLKLKLEFFNLVYKEGIFYYHENNLILFKIMSENGGIIDNSIETNVLQIVVNFELSKDPLLLLDKILDIYENINNDVEVRLLSSNKFLFTENEYNLLKKQILKFIESIDKFGLKSGDSLISRIFGKYFNQIY